MSRETRFIGLTARAERFVKHLKELPSDSYTTGMFGEKIPLRRWKRPAVPENPDDLEACFREIVQEVPWQSGPMIFTCLEKDCGNQLKYPCFEWIHDPRLGCYYGQNYKVDDEVECGEIFNRELGVFCV